MLLGGIALAKYGVTMVNGANADFSITFALAAIDGTATNVEITGPTGGFSVSGLKGGCDGAVVELTNLAGQTMTITHQGAGPARRPTGSFAIPAPTWSWLPAAGGFSWCRLKYSTSQSRWLVIGHT